jgi:hypothetical protein
MLREIRSAILPPWPWAALLRKWPEIVARLAEPPRQRPRYSYY